MKKVKITVLKTTLDQELAREYGAEGLGPCPMLREGQVFYADYAKPEGLCGEAWKAIYQYVWGGGGPVLLRRLDPPARRGHLLLQRRAPARDLQAGGHGGGSGRQRYAGAVKALDLRALQAISHYRQGTPEERASPAFFSPNGGRGLTTTVIPRIISSERSFKGGS